MDTKTYKQITRKLEKVCNSLNQLMGNHTPDDIFDVLMTAAPPDDVALIAIFTSNMQAKFVRKTVDLVYQYDEECESQPEICASCDNKETCPDRKDTPWIQ